MRAIKRWSAVILALALILTACGSDESEQGADVEAPVTPEPEITAAPETQPAATPTTEAVATGQEPTADFPEKEITMIVPFPAGSGNDSAFRTLSAVAEDEIGQPIVIVNKVGGAGTVGLSELAGSEADGYTIGIAPSAALTMLPLFQDTTYEGPGDFTPFVQAYTVPLSVFVKADSPLQSVDDFIAKATEEPGSITVGVPCERCVLDLDLELLMEDVGGELQLVPFAAGEQAVAVLNGSVDVGIGFPNLVAGQVEAGDLRHLFFFSNVPVPNVDAPVISDALDTRANIVPSGYGLAPLETPPEVVEILHQAYKAAVESPDFEEYAATSGLLVDYAPPTAAAENLQQQAEEALAAMRELGWLE